MAGTSRTQGPTPPPGAPRIPPILLKIIVTTLIGGITYLLTDVTHQPQVWKLTAAIFIGGAALIVQFLVDFEGRLGTVETCLNTHNTEMRELVAGGFARINEVTALFGRVDRSALPPDGVTRLVRAATRVASSDPEIMRSFAQVEMTRFTTLMEDLDQNLVDHDGEDHTWIVALTRCATATIDATSTWVDRDYWPSEEGQRYLRAQRDAIRDRGVHIRRLFIVDTVAERTPELTQLCDDHVSLGIEVRTLVLSELAPIARMDETNDVIVFDEALSYEIRPDARRVNSHTVMDMRGDRVQRRVQRFKSLWDSGT